MAIQADHFDLPADSARAPARRDAIARAGRHSRHVRILRIALPVCALAIGMLYFLTSGHEVSIGDMNASVSRVEIAKDRLRMVDPELKGVTDDNGAYKVTAEYAEQEVGNTKLVYLHKVRAEVNNGPRGWTRLTSPKGLFDTKTQALTLTGDIKVTTHSGLTSYLTRADVDMKSQIITSTEPVKVVFPDGELTSRAMHIAMKTREISFLGDVKLRTAPKRKDKAPAETAKAGGSFARAFDSGEPIEVEAPRLTIYDTDRIAHFSGGVVTSQGGSRMNSNELKAYYVKSASAVASGGARVQPVAVAPASGKLTRIEAIGDVRIATADGRTATGAVLVYDAGTRQLLIDRGVTVGQGASRLEGSRMIVDLATSVTRFPAGKRVRGHFVPKAPDLPDEARQVASARKRPQGIDLGGGGRLDLSGARGKPLDIEADSLTIHDAEKEALFDGNVLTRQGGMDMRSASLRVFYGGGEKAGREQGGAASVTKVRAEGSVLITTDKDQAVTSEWAVYDAASRIVTIGGNVVLTQKENVIKGERLVIDLNTGRSRFEDRGNVATNGRVRMLFTPKKDMRDRTKPGDR